MRYMGSKARHAKDIIPILMNGHDQSKPYVEPFVGGGNLFSEVPAKIKWGNDTAKYAICVLEDIARGWTPPEWVSEEEYCKVKENPEEYPQSYVGFVAYCCSYAGKFWGGYWRSKDSKGKIRNGAKEQVKNLLNQRSGLVGAKFTVGSYLEMEIPDGSTVYCDPPYVNTTKYQSAFDHKQFWDWCESISRRCRVFVSEYCAPPNWINVWEKSVTNSLDKDTGSKRGKECLFALYGGKANNLNDFDSLLEQIAREDALDSAIRRRGYF